MSALAKLSGPVAIQHVLSDTHARRFACSMSRKMIRLVLDFDGTLTKQDTLHLVAEAGYQRHNALSGVKDLPQWQNIVDAYVSDYKSHVDKYHPEKSDRTTLVDEFQWLNSLETAERASADRVMNAGVFDHVTASDVENAATLALESYKVELRPGWADLLAATHTYNSRMPDSQAPKRGNLLEVISVNWSRWFIWSVLWRAATNLKDQALAKQTKTALADTAIFANEIDSVAFDVQSSTVLGGISPRGSPQTLRTAGDKARLFLARQTSTTSTSSSRITVIYIGDSTTDLECLVTADIGICILPDSQSQLSNNNNELVSTCQRIGIALKPLTEYNYSSPLKKEMSTQFPQRRGNTIYHVADFDDVVDFVKKLK